MAKALALVALRGSFTGLKGLHLNRSLFMMIPCSRYLVWVSASEHGIFTLLILFPVLADINLLVVYFSSRSDMFRVVGMLLMIAGKCLLLVAALVSLMIISVELLLRDSPAFLSGA